METAKKIEHPVDRVMEPIMASLIGCSPKSLEHQRYQGLIPPWVWAKENGRIYYYISRYNEWAESRAPCRPVLKSSKEVRPHPVHLAHPTLRDACTSPTAKGIAEADRLRTQVVQLIKLG